MARRRFLVVGVQRSGTSVTHTCLAGHPEVSTTGDEVRTAPLFTHGTATFTHGNDTWRERQAGYRALFDALSLLDDGPGIRAHGMKVAVGSPEEAMDLGNALREHLPDVHVVLVHRADLIAQFASLQRARSTGVWHSWQGAGDAAPMHIATDRFLGYAHTCRRVVCQLRTLRHSHPFHEVDYERTIQAGDWQPLFAFLGLRPLHPSWLAMQKVAPPVRNYVTGYDDLARALAATTPPDESVELELARQRAIEQLREISPATLLSRATAALSEQQFATAEHAALAALDRSPEPTGTMRRAGFDALEAAWPALASVPRALAGMERLAARYRDDARCALLHGIVLCFADRRVEAIAVLERARQLDPQLARVDEVLANLRG